jgi:hypothetical protein
MHASSDESDVPMERMKMKEPTTAVLMTKMGFSRQSTSTPVTAPNTAIHRYRFNTGCAGQLRVFACVHVCAWEDER